MWWRAVRLVYLFIYFFISFPNLMLNIHKQNKDIDCTKQAGTPQQLTPITAGPEHIKLK